MDVFEPITLQEKYRDNAQVHVHTSVCCNRWPKWWSVQNPLGNTLNKQYLLYGLNRLELKAAKCMQHMSNGRHNSGLKLRNFINILSYKSKLNSTTVHKHNYVWVSSFKADSISRVPSWKRRKLIWKKVHHNLTYFGGFSCETSFIWLWIWLWLFKLPNVRR